MPDIIRLRVAESTTSTIYGKIDYSLQGIDQQGILVSDAHQVGFHDFNNCFDCLWHNRIAKLPVCLCIGNRDDEGLVEGIESH